MLNESIINNIIRKIDAGDRSEEKITFLKIADICNDILSRQYFDKESINLQEEMIASVQDLLIYFAEIAAYKDGRSTINEKELETLVHYLSTKGKVLRVNVNTLMENIAKGMVQDIKS